MTSSQTNYRFPPFYPPPHYFSPPPPPAAKPPSHSTPPPPSPPHKRPPPPPSPPHVNPPPPPPHIRPPPPPPPPSPSPDNNPTVIVIVFVSLGCLFFLAFLSVALCCFLKKRKKKKMVQETDIINVDEHLKVKEAIVPAGPHGEPAVVLLVDDDIHIQEQIKKNEMVGQAHDLHGNSAQGIISSAIGKKKKKNMVQETGKVNIDEHLKVKEAMVAGPHEVKALALCVEDDKNIHEEIERNEKVGEGLHGKSGAIGKGKKMVEDIEVVNVDEHLKVKEGVIAAGPHGDPQAVLLLTKEDDVHIQEEIKKNEKVGEGLHGKSAQGISSAIGKGEGPSIFHHRLGHKA